MKSADDFNRLIEEDDGSSMKKKGFWRLTYILIQLIAGNLMPKILIALEIKFSKG